MTKPLSLREFSSLAPGTDWLLRRFADSESGLGEVERKIVIDERQVIWQIPNSTCFTISKTFHPHQTASRRYCRICNRDGTDDEQLLEQDELHAL